MSSVRIAPSLLACDLARVGAEVADVEAGGADLLHFDVMDGHFVPNLTFGPGLCAAVRRLTSLPLDIHLMVTNPDILVEPFAAAGASAITVHVEAVVHLHRTLARIRGLGVKAGVALNPLTPTTCLEDIWPFADLVLVMSVNPGFGGQSLIPQVLEKVSRIKAMAAAAGWPGDLSVDGGIDGVTAPGVRAAGAGIIVAGSAVFGARDRRQAIRALRGEEDS
jgi:ribulose-phosphate 3-epimerase